MRLYESQYEAVMNLDTGKVLVGGVGSGKTLTSLAFYYKSCGSTLEWIRPDSKKQLINKMTQPVDLYVITTGKKRDSLEWEEECIHFLLTGGLLKKFYPTINVVVDSWNNIKKYSNVTGKFFIFDEQHASGTGVWGKSFVKIAKKNRWILCSATPGDNWGDWANIFIANGFYKNITEFNKEHAVYSRYSRYPYITGYIGVRKLEMYRDSVTVPIAGYVGKPFTNEKILCEYNKNLYKDIAKTRFNPYKDEPIQSPIEFVHTLQRVVYTDTSRFEKVLNIINKRKKVIIFYNYDYELEVLRSLSEYGINVAEYNGHKHEDIPKEEPWVYLVQYISGSEAWNCILTDTVVFYSQPYSYKQLVQARGRIDRMNSPYKHIYYYTLFSGSKIEVAIEAVLQKKKKFNVKMFVGDRIKFINKETRHLEDNTT